MKKNIMMRLASFLLVAVLISTSAISGTYAKYVTSDDGSDFARVAEWGVVIEAKSFGMFTDKYETDDETATFTGEYSVDGEGEDVLAPGTEGEFANIKITGKPEVAVDVDIVATVAVSDNWKVGDEFYCPVVITVGTEEISGLDYDSATAFAEAIKLEIEDKSEQYAPNTDLGTIYDNTNLDLAWAWAFEGAADSEQTDEKDTALGDAAAAGNELMISIGVAITVTQID